MGAFFALFKRKEPKTPIKGFGARLKNILLVHYRGLIGFIVPVIVLIILLEPKKAGTVVKCLWICLTWSYFWQPVNVPVTGLIPIFMLPMLGAMDTKATCGSYMNEGIMLFILANMLLLLWNNSGLDRRLIVWFLCAGDTSQFSPKRMLFKCCTCGFFLSMFCNRLIVCSIMTQYVTPVFVNLQAATSRAYEPDFNEVRFILNNAIQTSCSIGSIAILHASFGTLAFRAIFYQTSLSGKAWHDIFNYLEYTSFAFPAALIMLIVNMGYHILLIKIKAGKKPMSPSSMNTARNAFLNVKKDIPSNITLHEKLTLFFMVFALLIFFFRWNKFVKWSEFQKYEDLPLIRDATVAALFVILLHSLPNSGRFIKVLTAKKKSQMGAVKPESAILWWRFVDKNTNYGYFFVIGSGVALCSAVYLTKFDKVIRESAIGKIFFEQPLTIYLLLVCIMGTLFSNIITSAATVAVLMPFIMSMRKEATTPTMLSETLESGRRQDAPVEVVVSQGTKGTFERLYLGALAIGVASNFGFTAPFLYTPAYFCHHTGKVPKKKMAVYGVGSAVLCLLILWVLVSFYAPVLWTSSSIDQETLPTTTTTAKPKDAGDGSLRIADFTDGNNTFINNTSRK